MAGEVLAKIRVIPAEGAEDQVAALSPEAFTQGHLNQIADLINASVATFQTRLKEAAKADNTLQLGFSEVEITFGIDLQAKGGITIGSIFEAGATAGAAFQVHIKLAQVNVQKP